jgi:sulfonate dioxygenase
LEKFEPLQPFEHHDPGKDADPSYPDLLGPDTTATPLTPTIGTEIRGIQLSTLTAAGKSQLARFVAERKVVAFRDQDFASLPIPDALAYGAFFGRHHVHPTSGAPEGYPEIHLIHRSAGDTMASKFFENRTSSVTWHADVSYEAQPPGTTFLYVLDIPETGGDTLFSNAVEAYNRLSPALQERLHGLKAVHSGFEQAEASVKRGGIKRREPVTHVHPLVRTHPVTGEKALYVNAQCKPRPLDSPSLDGPERDSDYRHRLTGIEYSHPPHRRPQEGRVRRPSALPQPAHRPGRRLPGARQVGEGHRRGVG